MPNVHYFVVVAALLTSFLMAMSSVNAKIWPDFSCHPTFDDTWRKPSVKYNTFVWNECQEEEKTNKICAKLCVLKGQNMLYPMSKRRPDDPLNFEIDSFVDHLAAENGYKDGMGGDPATDLMNKVRFGMEGCKEKHKEVLGWKMNSTCEKWTPLLKCIDTVYGC
jgi:hypothetical protein